ncbi:MAG: UDP-N-acetylglucosamine--N-acetylmuramyl-(pentapeptide) pyrophosphoryl-undecaprenol N-acetylglucosamine transferase [Brevinematales bacterium]|nr:UDP-N-acetylglucosamine--N-acetylmuramyl-(pentapeptide) pyrophosphoryl-undecaprenol N-acetylglucosamine transferase [Brevinematales bacterium]
MNIIIVSGGTGGHISPGISLYNSLKQKGHNVIFITNSHALKFPIVGKNVNKNDIITISISKGLSKNLIRNLVVFWEFIISLFEAIKVIISTKTDLILLTGGYVSGPVGIAGIITGKPIIVFEQNSVMGITNKILSIFAKKVILTFPLNKVKKYRKNFERIGNPIRYSEEDIIFKNYAKNTFGFNGEDKVVGIILGSQGAKRVNEIISENIKKLTEMYKVIWITGNDYYEDISSKFSSIPNLKLFPFMTDVNIFFSAVDVVITRGGASTLSEIAFFGVPPIIIPFPYAANNHQYYNGLFFESRGAGIVIEERELTYQKLIEALELVFKNYDIFKTNVKKLFPPKTTETIVSTVLQLISN